MCVVLQKFLIPLKTIQTPLSCFSLPSYYYNETIEIECDCYKFEMTVILNGNGMEDEMVVM